MVAYHAYLLLKMQYFLIKFILNLNVLLRKEKIL